MIFSKNNEPKNSLRKQETFEVPLDILFYGSSIVASVSLLIAVVGGCFL